MSILSWLKQVTSGDAAAHQPAVFAEGEEEFRGLNMKSALDAHTAWTHRLEAKIEGTSDEDLDIAKVAGDGNCPLGKWIHGEAKANFHDMAEYEELKRIHADFHLNCGKVLNDVENGDETEARQGLKIVRHCSGDVQLALIRFYEKAREL